MDVFNAFNDYAKQITKGLFIYGEDAELRKITSVHQFIIMVLKQKVMTLSLVIFFVQQLVQPSQFTSVVKN